MAQKHLVYLCDLCKADGEVSLAKGLYFSQESGQTYAACSKHLKDVRKYAKEGDAISVSREFEIPGDADENTFYE